MSACLVRFALGDSNPPVALYRSDFFCDFIFTWSSTKFRDPYNWITKSMETAGNRCYPPLAYFISYLFYFSSDRVISFVSGLCFIILTIIFELVLVFFNLKAPLLKKFVITIIFLFSATVLFSFQTGNIIILAAALALVFLFGFDSDNKAVRELSYIALALSAGIKLYPALFGLLILKRKRYKDAIRVVIYGLIAFFLPFLFFKGGFGNIPLFLRNVYLFGELYKFVDHPAFNFKYFANGISDHALRELIYSIFIVVDKILLVASVVLALLTKVKWREVLLMSVCLIWSSIHSGLYIGLFFFAGMVFFLNDAKKNVPNTICFLCMALILNPLRIVMSNGKDLSNALSNIGCSCLAITMIVEIFIELFKSKKVITRT